MPLRPEENKAILKPSRPLLPDVFLGSGGELLGDSTAQLFGKTQWTADHISRSIKSDQLLTFKAGD